jgi:hypothetical protein
MEMKSPPQWLKTFLVFIGGVVGTIFTLFLTNWLSLGEADLVCWRQSSSCADRSRCSSDWSTDRFPCQDSTEV